MSSRLESIEFPQEALEISGVKAYLQAHSHQNGVDLDGKVCYGFDETTTLSLARDREELTSMLEQAKIPYDLWGEGIGYGEDEADGCRIYYRPDDIHKTHYTFMDDGAHLGRKEVADLCSRAREEDWPALDVCNALDYMLAQSKPPTTLQEATETYRARLEREKSEDKETVRSEVQQDACKQEFMAAYQKFRELMTETFGIDAEAANKIALQAMQEGNSKAKGQTL